ncbi:MAG: 3-deoxy-D-manno-octulosonic acid transferase [Opitutae bacterium]|nr:3-deoxy-D-manno-octulosonic acid transferase [Opitutae bacterium]
MLWLYRIIFLPALVLASPYYLRRMRRRGGYGENFSHRFGVTPPLPPKRPGVKRIWLQAVSVGEVLAIAPILEALRREPDTEIYLTTSTSTGYQLALQRYASLVLAVGYFPLDWWGFSRRAWQRIAPDLVVLTEGERWPEHLRQARARGVPVVCVNARLSDRGYRRLRSARWAVPTLFGGITRLLPCSGQDAARFRELGFPPESIVATGNIKLDVTIPPLTAAERAQLRRELGLSDGLVLLGSSTWPGEEAALLAAWQAARAAGQRVSLLLVPRHAERRAEIEALLQAAGCRSHFRSRGAAPDVVDVAVGDTTGELRRLTQLADLVFVGKSLAPHHEGQTPVEAAALEKPILFGPEMSNFREIARDLTARGAARTVADDAQLSAAVNALLADAPARTAMSTAARAWHEANQGAVARTVAVLQEMLAGRR